MDPPDFSADIDQVEQSLGDQNALIFSLRALHFRHIANGMASKDRLEHWQPRGQPLILRILGGPYGDVARQVCWEIITHTIQLSSYVAEDPSPEDHENMDSILQAGLLDILLLELARVPRSNNALLHGLIAATNVCLYERFVPIVIQKGICESLIAVVQDMGPLNERNRLLALIALTNVALFPLSHAHLLRAGALQIAIGLLRHLASSTNLEVDLGLTAGFLICRIAGRDETGPGMQNIQDNHLLIEKLQWILEEVLNAGPHGIVLDSHWNPANIMLDVSILSQSNMNKPLLKEFIPLILRSLNEYGDGNRRLVKYCIVSLLELYQHDECRTEINRHKLAFLSELRKKRPYFSDASTFQGTLMMQLQLENAGGGSMSDMIFHVLRQLRNGLPSIQVNVNTGADW